MTFLKDFIPDTDDNNRCIQRALREIDENALLKILCGIDEESALAIRRNLSENADKAIMAEVEEKRGKIYPASIENACYDFLRRLTKFKKYIPEVDAEGIMPSCLNLETKTEVLEFFSSLSASLYKNGPKVFQTINLDTNEILVHKGLEYLQDGLDPMLMRSLLERIKTTRLKEMEDNFNMIIEGFDSIAVSDIPGIVSEKLKAFMPKLHDK